MYTTVPKWCFTEIMETEIKTKAEEQSHIVMENLKHEDFKTAYSTPATLSEDYNFQSSDDGSELSSRITQSTKDINLQLRCRLCAHVNKCMIDIFDFDAASQNIPSMIHLCLPIMVKQTDTLPKQVCLHCSEELERCYRFHQAVAEADEQLLAFERLASGNVGEMDGNWATFPPYDRKHGLTGGTLRRNSDIEMINGKLTNSLGERPTADTTATKNELSSSLRPCTVVITETRQKTNFHAKKVEKSSTDPKHLNPDSTAAAFDIGTTTASRIVQKTTLDSSEVIGATCSRSEADAAQEKKAEHKVDPAIQKRSDAGERQYGCTTCAKKFKRKDHLVGHNQIHSDTRELYRCNLCPKILKSKNGLSRHQELHTRGYSCKYCAKRFDAKEDRKRHYRVHTGKRPHEKHLKVVSATQKRSDAGERHYRCTTCPKKFNSNHDLVRHNQIHSDVRELYKCNLCSKMFKSKNGLSGHQELHTRGGL